ncbi:hypothetical protein AKJ13_16035 [Methylobacterium sp. ARG-1]|nr:hypothetical protein AKJ13_16035 [Methylobacterium sp. ARG-1]
MYRSTSSSVWWPVTAMISCGVQPRSASRAAVALRSPWAEQCGKPAWLHHSRNRLPKPAVENGLPYSVTRKVRCALGAAAMASARSGNTGTSIEIGLRCSFFAWTYRSRPTLMCCGPRRGASSRREAV